MHYYNIKLRLNGNPLNEIKKQVSTPELLVIQFVHGDDAVADVTEVKNEKVDQREEKNRLRETYDIALSKKGESINSIFGALGALPERLPSDLIEKFNLSDEGLKIYDPKNLHKPKNSNASLTDEQYDRANNIGSADDVNLGDLFDED